MQLLGSGPILTEAIKAQQILAEKYNVAADVWSVTSYNELRREALKVDRWNRLHPAEPAKTPYIQQVLGGYRRPDYRGIRLHEGRAGPDRAVAAGALSWRWAPMASAAAITANICGSISK